MDSPAGAELRLAACQTVAEVERVLAGGTVDIATVLAAVPECVDAGGLARLVLHAGLTDAAAPQCIDRAVAIDERTGRTDWAVTWLAGLAPHVDGAARALLNARVLDRLVRAGGEYALADIIGMPSAELVSWLVDQEADLDALAVAADPELAEAWNEWWGEHLFDTPAGLLPRLVRAHPAWFADHVLLAAVFAVGAPCGGPHDAMAAFSALAANRGIDATSSGVAFSSRMLALVQSDPSVSALRDLAPEDVAALVVAGRSQARAALHLAQLGHVTDLPAIVAVQGNATAQERLLARATQAARQSRKPPLEVAATLQELYRLGLFADLAEDSVKREWLETQLHSCQFDNGRQLLAADPLFANSVAARDAVCAAARELFDNAADGDATQAARRCLDVAPQHHDDDAVRRELLLIDAAQLVRTLGPAGVLPLEIRLAPDIYDLVRLILARHPGSHRKQRTVRQIASTLQQVADPACAPDELRDFSVHSASDALVLALMLEAANAANDGEAAHRIVRQLAVARSFLHRAMAATEDHRAAQLLAPAPATDGVDRRPLEARAVDCVWRACAVFGASAAADAEERQDALSLALCLCPVADIPMLLAQWHPAHGTSASKVSAGDRVCAALLGNPVSTSLVELDDVGEAVSREAMRTFDPEVIRRCLRGCAREPHTQEAVRGELLMEWLEFVQTTSREPTTEAARRLRSRIEDEITSRHAPAACETMVARVLPQLDQTSHAQLARFYAFYARCLGSPVERRQAEMRAQLAQRLVGLPDLHATPFNQLVDLELGSMEDACVGLVTDGNIRALVALAPNLADLCPLPALDGNCTHAAPGRNGRQLASSLCAWYLCSVLACPDGAALFGDLLAEWVTRLEPDDLVALATRVAFGPQEALGLAARCEAVDLCAVLAGDVGEGVRRARAYTDFMSELDAQRDPFTFAPLPREWASRLEHPISADDDSAAVEQRLRSVLCEMIAAGEGAYFVCQSYACVADLVAQWGGQMAGLADVYVEALSRVISGGADDVLVACEGALELCSFSYGDSTLGAVLGDFRRDFGAILARTAREGRLPGGPEVSSTLRLALLRIHDEYCADVDRVAADAADVADQAAGGSDLRLRLLADKHWGVRVPSTGDERHAVWKALLLATRVEHADVQVPELAGLLAEWHDAGAQECWALLLEWTVRNCCPQLVPRLLAQLPEQHAPAVGSRAFGVLIAEAAERPATVCALAVLALLFPTPDWADTCMGMAVHTVLSVPSQLPGDQWPVAEDADEDAWGIDDVPLDDCTAGPAPEDLALARDAIMDCACLHLAIAKCGYVSACVASTPLLHSVGRSLLRASQLHPPLGDECLAIADSVTGGALELIRRTTATLCEIGLEHVALQWMYELFGVPLSCRFAVSRATTEMWQRHLDTLVCGPRDVAPYDSTNDLARSETKAVRLPPVVPDEPDEDAEGWGDDDDIDLDADNVGLVADTVDLNADAAKPHFAAEDAPPAESDGWGDDDVDLDADLDNL